MTPDQVLATYDDAYARRYDDAFLLTPELGFRQKTEIELLSLRLLTGGAASWLDVACGTGFFLQHGRGHPALACAGLDLSAPMLAVARARNPDAELVEGDFLDDHPDLAGRFDVTSCLWGAYGLQESMREVERLVENLARWTREGGAAFVPVFVPERFVSLRAEGRLMPGVTLDAEDGTRWSYLEPDGKRHDGVLAPPVPAMRALFERWFSSVSVSEYPHQPGVPMAGLWARERR